ncbi:hypothetical protein FB595_1731, partial [Sphingobium sp. AEW010]
MNKLCCTPTGAVLVAIDMSKNRQEVLIERPEGGRRRRMTVMATKEVWRGDLDEKFPSIRMRTDRRGFQVVPALIDAG